MLSLAENALRALAELAGDPAFALSRAELLPVSVATEQLGRGYPHATPAGSAARAAFAAAGYAILDDTYSAKAAAHVLASTERDPGPTLFWCTKSSAPLPDVNETAPERA